MKLNCVSKLQSCEVNHSQINVVVNNAFEAGTYGDGLKDNISDGDTDCDENLTLITNSTFFPNTPKGLTFCSHNINHISNKIDELKLVLECHSENKPDVYGLCETFLTGNTHDDEIAWSHRVRHTGAGADLRHCLP